jgi:hypothetical protein
MAHWDAILGATATLVAAIVGAWFAVLWTKPVPAEPTVSLPKQNISARNNSQNYQAKRDVVINNYGGGVSPEQVATIFRQMLAESGAPVSKPNETPPRLATDETLSKFLTLILRHRPAAAAVDLDQYGWADVQTLVRGVQVAGYQFSPEDLDRVVNKSRGNPGEQRFSFSTDKRRIRANWGHTFPVLNP